jgi:hypothetical protein
LIYDAQIDAEVPAGHGVGRGDIGLCGGDWEGFGFGTLGEELHEFGAVVGRVCLDRPSIAHGGEGAMPQVSGRRPFDEFHLADQLRFDPADHSGWVENWTFEVSAREVGNFAQRGGLRRVAERSVVAMSGRARLNR